MLDLPNDEWLRSWLGKNAKIQDDTSRALDSLTPRERYELTRAIDDGRVASDKEQARVAIELARLRQRMVAKELPIAIGVAVAVAAISLIIEGNLALFAFVLGIGLLVSMGAFWWMAEMRPLRRAEVINRIFVEQGRLTSGANWSKRDAVYLWTGTIGLAWLLVFGVGLLANFIIDVPDWLGIPLFFLAILVIYRLLSRTVSLGSRGHRG